VQNTEVCCVTNSIMIMSTAITTHSYHWAINKPYPYTLSERSEMNGKFRNLVREKDANISWTDRVRNKEVLHRVKKDRIILQTIKGWKANWIVHIVRNAF